MNARQAPAGRTAAEPSRRRLFFALWPEASANPALAAAVRLLKPTLSARWIRPQNLHITLAFLGEVEAGRLQAAKTAADAAHAEGFELALDQIEWWRKPQILCLTPSAACPALERLAAGLAAQLQTEGFKLDKRPFRAHLSLARDAACPPGQSQLEQAVAWRSSAFALVESRQDGRGSCYTTIQSWPLSPAAGQG